VKLRPASAALLLFFVVLTTFMIARRRSFHAEPNVPSVSAEQAVTAQEPIFRPLENATEQALMEAIRQSKRREGQLEARVAELERRLANLERMLPTGDGLSAERTAPKALRPWGPEQAIGAPNTWQAGDLATAWASRTPDGGAEWLQLSYSNAVTVDRVRVRETFNPGAIARVTAVQANGQEATLWEGDEPDGVAPVETEFTAAYDVTARVIKIYLDTSRVPGWNEIDAVELVGRDGSRQWAAEAAASSTYADGLSTENAPTNLDDRFNDVFSREQTRRLSP
jgi:hypothetical protein